MFEISDELEPLPYNISPIENSMRLYVELYEKMMMTYYVREFFIDTTTTTESVLSLARIIGCSKSMTK